MWSHFAVAYSWRSLSHSHPKAPGGSQAGDQCSAAPVPRGSQHPGLPQHATQPRPILSGGQAAMGVLGVWSCARLPQLGPSFGAGGQHSERVSHVPRGGPLCAAVAWLWTGLLRGHRCAHACLCAMWTRVLGEVGQVLGTDSSTPRHPCISCGLPLLCHPAQPHSGLFQANLPGPGGLSWGVLLRQRRLDRNGNMLWNRWDYFMLFCCCFFVCVSQLWKEATLLEFRSYTVDSAQQRARDCSGPLVAVWMATVGFRGAHWTADSWLLHNKIQFQLSCQLTALNKAPALSCLLQYLLVFYQRAVGLSSCSWVRTEPDNGIIGSVGKIRGGRFMGLFLEGLREFLQSQTAGLLAGRRNSGCIG